MNTRIELVTPEMAKGYLINNYARQRNVSDSHVIHLAQQMAAGQWQLNGEPIIFDHNGNVINGQHRLHAVIRSGVAVQFLIVSGVDESAFLTIDSGKPRSSGNIFAIKGIPNYNNTAACVYGVMNYRRALKVQKTIVEGQNKWTQIGGSLNSYIRPSKIDMLKEYEANAAGYQSAIAYAAKCRKLGAQSIFTTIAALALIDGSHADFVEPFFNALCTGINLTENHPAYRLRCRLEQNKALRQKFSVNHATLLTAKAWNYYALEKPCKLLRIDNEIVFPVE